MPLKGIRRAREAPFLSFQGTLKPAHATGGHVLPLGTSESPIEASGAELQSPSEKLP